MILTRNFASWITPAIAAAIPLAIAPGWLYYYDVTPKVVLLYAGAAAALPFVQPRQLLRKPSGRWFCGLLAAAWISLVVATLFSTRPELSIFGSSWRRFGVITQTALFLYVFAAAADLSSGPERLRAYLRAAVFAAIPVALYSILQYSGWDPLLDPGTYHVGTGMAAIVRPPATLGYVTYLANYLVFGSFQGLALYRLDKDRRWRWAGIAAAVLASVAIVLSGTRAAWLALAVGGLVFSWKQGVRLSPRTLASCAVVAALALVFYFSPAGRQMRSRMQWFRDDPAGGARLYLWRDSLRMVMNRPLIGSGPETFSIEFPKVQSRDLSRAFPEFYHESAHNVFLDAATAQGISGLLILLAAAAMGLRSKCAVLLAGFAAILICHLFSVFTVPTALTFWLTLAMMAACASGAAPPVRDRRMIWMLPVSLIFLAAAGRLLAGDYHLARMRATLDPAEYSLARKWGAHADIWYSRKLLSMGRAPEALEPGMSATITADDPYNAWMNLGLINASLGRAKDTEDSIRNAIAASPNWYKPHLALAQFLLATNRRDEGQRELQIARDLDPAAAKAGFF